MYNICNLSWDGYLSRGLTASFQFQFRIYNICIYRVMILKERVTSRSPEALPRVFYRRINRPPRKMENRNKWPARRETRGHCCRTYRFRTISSVVRRPHDDSGCSYLEYIYSVSGSESRVLHPRLDAKEHDPCPPPGYRRGIVVVVVVLLKDRLIVSFSARARLLRAARHFSSLRASPDIKRR